MEQRGRGYQNRFGSSFKQVGKAFADAITPLCRSLVEFHFGLRDTLPLKLMNLRATQWIEYLAKSPLENTFSAMQQVERYGGSIAEIKEILYRRKEIDYSIHSIINQFENLQAQWVRLLIPRALSKGLNTPPHAQAMKHIFIQWGLCATHELKVLDLFETQQQRCDQI